MISKTAPAAGCKGRRCTEVLAEHIAAIRAGGDRDTPPDAPDARTDKSPPSTKAQQRKKKKVRHLIYCQTANDSNPKDYLCVRCRPCPSCTFLPKRGVQVQASANVSRSAVFSTAQHKALICRPMTLTTN